MNTSPQGAELSVADLLALPENDGIDRDLISGELREKPTTFRNPRQARTLTLLAHALQSWLDSRPRPRGEVLTGGPAFLLSHDPDSLLGIDLAYLSADLASRTPDAALFIDGPPILAVEILSPLDLHGEIVEKVELYLHAGVQVVWVVDPDLRTVVVHRPDMAAVMFNHEQEITAEPHLPGFKVSVAEFF